MHIYDTVNKDECREQATQELKKHGIKCRPKKPKQVQGTKSGTKVFKVPLLQLPVQTVLLGNGQEIPVPKLVYQLCSFILTRIETEGIFRKEGAKSRQNELKRLLDAGASLDDHYNVIDVAVILKTFLRELPDPLVPYGYHELFLRCVLLDKEKLDALLLACLLLPIEHLNTLTYLMQFFKEVSQHSNANKMTPYNIAVCIGPTLFPVEEKLSPNPKLRLAKTTEIFQLIIENADQVGVVPDSVLLRIEALSKGTCCRDAKKKRRSGSLTRMFNGLKKIVGGRTEENPTNPNKHLVTPDLLMTPIHGSIKKKRIQSGGLSTKKRKEVISRLPNGTTLGTPFTPVRTPVSMNLSGRSQSQIKEPSDLLSRDKKLQWFSRSKSVKNLKLAVDESNDKKKTSLERRWSAIGQYANLKKTKKRTSCGSTLAINQPPRQAVILETEKTPEPDYIRVPKIEYEAIKNRVTAMERRISFEIESLTNKDSSEENHSGAKDVQTAYEQTLVQAEQLSPTADHLARRLSRELKIRKSEHKIMRSPSARKIGSLRRRSREVEKTSTRLSRHRTWHGGPKNVIPKRGKPDKAEECPTPLRSNSERSACNLSISGSSQDAWISAEGFFATLKSCTSDKCDSSNGRASIAKLRSQNAGMVLAKAKLFDQMKDLSSDSSGRRVAPRPGRVSAKIGSTRVHENRHACRLRTLKSEDVRRKVSSPQARRASQRHKLQLANRLLLESGVSDKENRESSNFGDKVQIVPLKDCNRIEGPRSPARFSTPKGTPHIKRSLHVNKSPKRLCRTPNERGTPLRALRTPSHQF